MLFAKWQPFCPDVQGEMSLLWPHLLITRRRKMMTPVIKIFSWATGISMISISKDFYIYIATTTQSTATPCASLEDMLNTVGHPYRDIKYNNVKYINAVEHRPTVELIETKSSFMKLLACIHVKASHCTLTNFVWHNPIQPNFEILGIMNIWFILEYTWIKQTFNLLVDDRSHAHVEANSPSII